MRLRAARECHEIDEQIDHPDHDEPEDRVPFRLGIFMPARDAEQIARARDENEEIVAEHDEPWREIAGDARAARALHDVERGGEQNIAAESEDHRRGVQRPQTPEIDPGQIEIEKRESELQSAI